MMFNVGKLSCLIFLLLAHVGMVSAQGVAYSSEGVSASLSVATTSVRQFYVAPTGRDSNDGSAAHPWATIAHASTLIAAGATVHVAPGTYTGYITTHASGTSSARLASASRCRDSSRPPRAGRLVAEVISHACAARCPRGLDPRKSG